MSPTTRHSQQQQQPSSRVLLLILTLLFFIYNHVESAALRSNNNDNYRIRQVQVLTRHGDRTPVHTIPNLPEVTWLCALPNDISVSPLSTMITQSSTTTTMFIKRIDNHGNPLPGNCSMGQLTQVGMQQHFELGKHFYNKYSEMQLWDNDRALMDQIRIESTDVPRTIQSAQSQFLGLVPPSHRPTTFPIQVQSEGTCDMFPNFAQCPKLALLRQNVVNGESYKQFEKNFAHVREQVLKNLGTTMFPGWTALYDVFACRSAHNYSLTHGWTQQLVNELTLGAETEYGLLLADKLFLRLSMGPFLKRIKEQLMTAMKSPNNRVSQQQQGVIRFSLHSGHDTSVAPLAAMLGFYDQRWPKYAANIVIELYERTTSSSNQFAVKVLYDGVDVTTKVCPAVIDSDFCEWSLFDEVTNHLIVKDQSEQCVV